VDSLVVKLILYLWQFLPKLLQGNAKFPTECQITFPSRITFLCRHVQFITSEQQDYKLGGFSIGYVHVTSEPTDSQALSFNMVGTILFTVTSSSPPLNGRALSLMFLSRLCPVYHLWTDMCPNLFPFYGTQTIMSSLSPLNKRVHNFVLLSPSLFPVRAGSSCCQVNTTTWTANCEPGVS